MSRKSAVLALALGACLPVTGSAQTAACEFPSQNQILATVAGRAITRLEAEAVWRTRDPGTFFSFERQRHEMTMHAVQEVIAETLLDREAARRGVTVDALLAAEVSARTSALGSPNEQRAAEARLAFVNELLARSRDLIEIHESAPRQNVPVDPRDPAAGPAEAPVTLVLFSDFQCPYCRQLEPALAAVEQMFGGQLRLIWKDFPLPVHRDARAAAKAARCAAEQGAFWRYRDELFRNQDDLSVQRLVDIARALDLDEERFSQCAASTRFDSAIDAAIEEGRRLGVNSTPTMFINGVVVTGAIPATRLEALIRDELKAER